VTRAIRRLRKQVTHVIRLLRKPVGTAAVLDMAIDARPGQH
jgi:hypothetical protein